MYLILSIQKKVVNIKKQAMKFYFVLLLASMMASVNSCELGNDAIQALYDRVEEFRKTKFFDPTNRVVPLEQYYHYYYRDSDGTKDLEYQLNREYLWESYKTNSANEIETSRVHYGIDGQSQFLFERDENGEFVLRDLRNHTDVKLPLRSFDSEIPNNIDENYKKLIIDLKTMRQKTFDFQKSLSKDELERVQIFDYTIFSNGNLLIVYSENGGGDITYYAVKKDGRIAINGVISCGMKEQKFDIVDGKVAVDAESLNLF